MEEEDLLSVGERWNLKSVDVISFLQDKLEPYESWVVQSSVYGDNREAFTVFFPILAGLSNQLGARALWAAILVEWSNLLLKWMFMGNRPYWWVPETQLYTNGTRPHLRQFPNTCESGPGTPSGHLMLNVALFYVATRGITRLICKTKSFNVCLKVLLTTLLYCVYATWIGVIFVSRLYIQAHFIHQNVLGVIIGLCIGQMAWKSQHLLGIDRLGAVWVAFILISSALGLYYLLLYNGLDPLWTLPMAFKHCAKPEYVRADTQPFFLMTRFTGASLGLGLGLASEKRYIVISTPRSIIRTVLTMKAGLVIGRIASLIQASLPTDDLVLFLALSVSLNTAMPFLIISLLPHFLLTIYYTSN